MTKIISRYTIAVVLYLSFLYTHHDYNKTLKSIILITLLILIVIRVIYDVKKYRKNKKL